MVSPRRMPRIARHGRPSDVPERAATKRGLVSFDNQHWLFAGGAQSAHFQQPPWPQHQRVPGFGGTVGDLRAPRPHPDPRGVPADIGVINANGDRICRYMNFDQIEEYREVAETVEA